MGCSRSRHVAPCIPYKYPSIWLIINLLVLIWTIGLIIEVARATGDINDRSATTRWYIRWYLLSAYIWVAEAGLDFWYFHRYEPESMSLLIIGNAVLALYFFVNASFWALKWANGEQVKDPMVAMIIYFFCHLWLVGLMGYRVEQQDEDGDDDDNKNGRNPGNHEIDNNDNVIKSNRVTTNSDGNKSRKEFDVEQPES